MRSASLADGRVTLISVSPLTDERGMLIPVDFSACGFAAVRAFIVKGTANAVRGGHGHRNTRQILQAAEGEIDLQYRHQGVVETVTLRPEGPVALIERGVWCRQIYRGSGAVLVVYCDAAYDPDDYILSEDLNS